MDNNELQEHLNQIMEEENNRPRPQFAGYAPLEMNHILYAPLDPDSPIRLKMLTDTDYEQIPVLNQVKHLMEIISEAGELKLTQKGFLPVKVVSELYHQGYMMDKYFEIGIKKTFKEANIASVNLSHILVKIGGLAKKRNGKLSLTAKGKKLLNDTSGLFENLLITYTSKFNWAYHDGYEHPHIGRFGFGFSLILVHKYGEKERETTFYADKYFKAFPQFYDEIVPRFATEEEMAARCYSLRTFERFMDYFGLVKIRTTGMFIEKICHIKKSPLFDKIFRIRAPKTP